MRILAVIRMVPDSRATIRVRSDGLRIETAGLKFVCDPFDEYAVEQAVRLKETRPDVPEVVAITVGPPDAIQTLRAALAVGADRGIHVCVDGLQTHDEVFLAEILAAAIRRADDSFDLILCGKQQIDNDSGELGPALAEFLDVGHIGAVTNLEVAEDGSAVIARRRIEAAEELVESKLPVLIMCDKGLVEPRYPALPNIIKAKKKPVETIALADLDGLEGASARTSLVGLTPPPERQPCRMIEGEPEDTARELVRLLRDEAKVV